MTIKKNVQTHSILWFAGVTDRVRKGADRSEGQDPMQD